MASLSIHRFIIACLLSATGALAWAQQPAAEADLGALSERAKRQADNPYKWIMILGDKPRTKKEEPKEKRPSAATPARESAPAAAAAQNPASAARAAERPVAPAAPPPAAQAITAPATSPAAKPAPVIPADVPEAMPEPALAAPAPKLIEEELDEPLRSSKQVQP